MDKLTHDEKGNEGIRSEQYNKLLNSITDVLTEDR